MEKFFNSLLAALRIHLFSPTASTDECADYFVTHLTKSDRSMRVHFFFPEETGLNPVLVYGAVPQEGSRIFIRSFRLKNPEKKNYNDYDPWIVERVDYSVNVDVDDESVIRRSMNGEAINHYEAQVMLAKTRKNV